MSQEDSDPAHDGVQIPKEQSALEAALGEHFSARLLLLSAHAWTPYGLTRRVADKDDFLALCRELRDSERFLFNMLIDVTCVDWLDSRTERFELVYQLLSLTHTHRLCLKVALDEENPEIESVRSLWPAANFLEREVWDMFGIKFRGHGDLRRILMYDEFEGHPLRKDYPLRGKQPRVQMRVPELRNTSGDMRRDELVSLPVRQRIGTQVGSKD
jgi:NADH-quinone oxidoreductase subunit C